MSIEDDKPLRGTLSRNPNGGSYKLRVRVPQGRGMVYKTVELGLGTRDEVTAEYVAAVVLSGIDKVFGLHTPRPYILHPDINRVITSGQIARLKTTAAMRLREQNDASPDSVRDATHLAHQLTLDLPSNLRDNSNR